MTDDARAFLDELLNTPSPTGFEQEGQKVWANYLRSHADSVESDVYGSAWATVEGEEGTEAPRIMLDAHVDEIGYMVKHITENGFLHIDRIGGSDRAIARAQRVRILTNEGTIAGVVGNTAIHLRDSDEEKIPKVHDLFVDIGADSREEAEKRGIRVGLPMVFDVSPKQLTEHRLTGRAIDNRLGGFIIAEVLRRLSSDRPDATVIAANSVQEEIGGHGAKMITHRLEPDVAIAFDVTHSTDSPGISVTEHGEIKMGEGPTVTHGTSNHPEVVQKLMDVAEEADIPLQHEASSRRTGTDTDSIFRSRSGVASALVSVPLRYMHSTVEVVDLRDVQQCVDWLVAFCKTIQQGDEFRARI